MQTVRRTLRKRSEHADYQEQSDSQRPRLSNANMFCFSFRLLPDPPIQVSSWLHSVFRFARTGHYIVLYPTFYRPVRSPTPGRRREIALFGPVRRARPNSEFYRPVVAATVPKRESAAIYCRLPTVRHTLLWYCRLCWICSGLFLDPSPLRTFHVRRIRLFVRVQDRCACMPQAFQRRSDCPRPDVVACCALINLIDRVHAVC